MIGEKEKNQQKLDELIDSAKDVSKKTTKIELKENIVNSVQPQQTTLTKPTRNYKKAIGISVGSLLAVVIIIFAAITILNITSDSIFNNVKIAGVDISQLNKDEAISKLQTEKKFDENSNISLKLDNLEFLVKPEEIGANFDYTTAVEQAYLIAREGNLITDNYNFIKTLWEEKEIGLNLLYDEELLNNVINNISANASTLINASHEVVGEQLIIKKGAAGKVVDVEALKILIIQGIVEGTTESITIPMIDASPQEINIEEIHKSIYKEPKDAYYTTEPFEIFKEEDGVDFAITMDEAKALLAEDKQEYIIPLKYTKAAKTTSHIGSEAFPDLLSTYTTTYITSKTNRTTNLIIAAGKINGHVLMPGETFSFNQVVGERTYAAGYKDAGVFVGGREEDGLAGGICQISSTLYNITVLGNLEIVSRTNHGMLPGYVSSGRDATVVYGAIDYVFKNNRSYPVKIETSVGGGYVTMNLYGTKEATEYEVSFETSYSATYYPSTEYIDTPDLAPGVTKVETNGYKGYKTTTYKVLKLNGEVVEKVWLSSDVYNPMNTVILRGIQPVVEPTPVPTPTPDPTPTPTPEPTPTPPPTTENNNTTGEGNSTNTVDTNTVIP